MTRSGLRAACAIIALSSLASSSIAGDMYYSPEFKARCRAERAQDFRDAETRIQDCWRTGNQDRCAKLQNTLEERLFDMCLRADKRKADSDARAALRANQPKTRRP